MGIAVEGKSLEVLQKGMILITEELVENSKNKSKDDLYELVDVALKSNSTEIYLLNDDNLIQQAQAVPDSSWQGEVLKNSKLQSIALAALYFDRLSKSDAEMLMFYHNAVSTYSANKVKILKITDKLSNNYSVLEQYLTRQMKYAFEYHRHHNHPVEISEIKEKIAELDDSCKYAVCVDVTDSFYKEDSILWQIEFKTKKVSYELENGNKLFIYAHPMLSDKIDEIFFGQHRVKSLKKAGIFDTDLIWKFHQSNIRLSDFYLKGARRLTAAHGTSLNPIEALAHDEFHKSICNLLSPEVRQLLYFTILPDIYEAYKVNFNKINDNRLDYYKIENGYSYLVDSDFPPFRNVTNRIEAAFEKTFFSEPKLGFHADSHAISQFYIAGQISLSMVTHPLWLEVVPNMGKFKFEGLFGNFSSWLNELCTAFLTAKDFLFATTFPQFDKRKYIILKALVGYITTNLASFNKKQLSTEVKNILVIALESMEQWKELKDLKNRVLGFYKNLPLLKDNQIKNLKALLDEIHFDLFVFENTHLRMHIHYDFFVRDLLQLFDKKNIAEQLEQNAAFKNDLIDTIRNPNISAQEKFVTLRGKILEEFSSINESADVLNNNNVSPSVTECKASFFNSSASLSKEFQDLTIKYEPVSDYIREQRNIVEKSL